MLRRSLLATLVSLPLVASCASGKKKSAGTGSSPSGDSRSGAGPEDIPGILTDLRRFDELLKAAQAAGLMGRLRRDAPLTLFAPTDSAFNAMDDIDLLRLKQDKARLRQLLEYHMVDGRFTTRDFVKFKSLKTMAGPTLTITKMGQVIKINEANIDQANIGTDNGVIHAIDRVLTPPRIS